ncbi:MAG: gliding motility protein GldN [Saprospiraceae bacterium]
MRFNNQLLLPAWQRTTLLWAFLIAPLFLAAQSPDDYAEIPLDDITQRNVVSEKMPLAYAPIREADIAWEKRMWRVIDVREKQNLPFIYPEAPLFQILANGIAQGKIPAYSTEDDKFTKRLSNVEVDAQLHKTDSILVTDFETGEDILRIVKNDINWENVQRFRVKEIWFWDAATSSLRVRILGIAPLITDLDENGNFRFERPLFWVHYPSAREYLAGHKAYTHADNPAANITWEDLFEMRYFASHVIKESNLYDRKIEEYLSGVDMLTESGKISDDLFAREHDMWTW